ALLDVGACHRRGGAVDCGDAPVLALLLRQSGAGDRSITLTQCIGSLHLRLIALTFGADGPVERLALLPQRLITLTSQAGHRRYTIADLALVHGLPVHASRAHAGTSIRSISDVDGMPRH